MDKKTIVYIDEGPLGATAQSIMATRKRREIHTFDDYREARDWFEKAIIRKNRAKPRCYLIEETDIKHHPKKHSEGVSNACTDSDS